jgi:uncharacterized repeat protein (TIGR01451 family)
VNVSALATAGAATVNWIPTPNGQAITSFVVRTLLANGAASGVPDFTVNQASNGIAPSSATINGLTNGVTVVFAIQACNASGCSPFSIPSGPVTPQVLTVPGTPTGLVASIGNGSAALAWTVPANSGGTLITSYTVTATPGALKLTVPASQTGVNFTGLTNGTTYSFTVHATNAVGSGAESLPSNAVTPVSPQGADLAITMTSPATVNAGAFVTFAMTVTNNGPGDAALVTLTDSLPGAFQSSTNSQGICTHTGSVFTCNLGAMKAGSLATVSVTVVSSNTALTNSASVQLRDASNNLLIDTSPANNIASSTTNVTVPVAPVPVGGGGGGGGTTTPTGGVSADIEINGSARNGGPNQGTGDTFTWQIKDNTGNTPAPNVVFTLPLPPSFQFVSASASQGTCGGIAPNAIGGTLTCNLASLPGGQTMVVTVNFVPLQVGTISTTGSATFGGTDTNTNNNSFTVTIQPR